MNTLVWTEGGGPNVMQRKRVVKALNCRSNESPPAAILSDSMWVRGVITAFKWLGTSIRAFRPTELNEAMVYLGLPPASRDQIEEALARLKSSVRSAMVGRIAG